MLSMYGELEERYEKIYFDFMTHVKADEYGEKILISQKEGEPTVRDDPNNRFKVLVKVKGDKRFLKLRMKDITLLYDQTIQQIYSNVIKFEYVGGDLDGLGKALETDLRMDQTEFVAQLCCLTDIWIISYPKNVERDVAVVQRFVEDYKRRHPVSPPRPALWQAGPPSSAVMRQTSPPYPVICQADTPSPAPLEKIVLNDRISLSIIEGDLTKMKCDAIVCPSSPDLSNADGIAKVVAEQCGSKFQSGCDRYVRVRRHLPTGTVHKQLAEGQISINGVKYVILAILPTESESDDVLCNAVYAALSEANMQSCKSVAFPAIICGDCSSLFREKCLRAFWDGVHQFVGSLRARPRRDIILVCDDIVTTLEIWETMQKFSSTSPPFQIPDRNDSLRLSDSSLTDDSTSGMAASAVDSSPREEFVYEELEKQFEKIYYEFMTIVTVDQYKKSVTDIVNENQGELNVRDDPEDDLKIYVTVTGNKRLLRRMMRAFHELYLQTSREVHVHMVKCSYADSSLEQLGEALERDLRGRSFEFVARLLSQSYIHVISFSKNREHDIAVVENFVENFKVKRSAGGLPGNIKSTTIRRVRSERILRGKAFLQNAQERKSFIDHSDANCTSTPKGAESPKSSLFSSFSGSIPNIFGRTDLSLAVSHDGQPFTNFDVGKPCSRSTLSPLHNNKQNELHRAVDTGDPVQVRKILLSLSSDKEREEVLRTKNEQGLTALQTAAYYGKVDCVSSILESVQRCTQYWALKIVQCADIINWTAGHKAAVKGHADVLECIMKHLEMNERYHFLKMQKCGDGMTVLHIAVDRNYVEVIRCLQKSLSTSDWLALLTIEMYQTNYNVLHKVVATKFDNTKEVVQELLGGLNMEAKFALLQRRCAVGNTAIQLAIQYQNYQGVRDVLISLPADKQEVLLLSRNHEDSTVMHLAAIHNNTGFFEDIRSGLSNNVSKLLIASDRQKLTPIFYAVSHHCREIVERFLTYFTPEEVYSQLLRKDENDSTALHLAAQKGGKIMQYLISLGDGKKYISEEINGDGDTILHILSANGDLTTINCCLHAMPDELRSELLRLTNRAGKTAYALASSGEIRRKLAWSAQQDGFYYLPTPPVVLVMYSTIDRDDGAHEEQETLVNALPPFGLKPIVKADLTCLQMLTEIRNAVKSDDISGIIIFIMGHGKQGTVHAKDGDVKIQDIIDTMCDPLLKNKPKVLMIQACQMLDNIAIPEETEDLKESFLTSENLKESASEKLKANYTERHDVGPPPSQYDPNTSNASSFEIHESDVVTMAATVSGGKAMRNTMIPVFAKQLLRFRNKDIHAIFLKTQKEVRTATPGQVLEYRTTLCQELCLDNVFKSSR